MDQQPNLQPETTTTESEVGVTGLLITLGVLLVAVVGVAAYIWYGMSNTPAQQMAEEVIEVEPPAAAAPPGPRTTAEKMELLENLERNPSNLDRDEKRALLNNL
jgi:cytochrome c-type biogenesis protein CcmH/NrfG